MRVHMSGSAATSSHTSGRGGVGRSASEPSVVRSAHAASVAELARHARLEQCGAAEARLLEPLQAEVVAPSLEQREAHLLVGQRLREERQVLPDELLLQVDRVRATRSCARRSPPPSAAPARGSPATCRRRCPPRAARRRPSLYSRAIVAAIARWLGPVLVAARCLPRDRAVGAEVGVDAGGVDVDGRRPARHLDDDVQLAWPSLSMMPKPMPFAWIRAATSKSALDGSSSPDGWLCTSISPRSAKPGSASTLPTSPRATTRALRMTPPSSC